MKAMPVAKSMPRAVIDELAFKPEDVYAKTELGVAELKRPECSLPQRLKTVLILIDGRTPYVSFARTLKSYGAVDELFSVLRDLGYVVKVGESQTVAASTERAPSVSSSAFATSAPASAPPVLRSTQPIPITRSGPPSPAPRKATSVAEALGDPADWDLPVIPPLGSPGVPTPEGPIVARAIARPATRQTAYEPPASLVPSLSAQSRALKTSADLLCDAMSNHAGFDGMELMLAIERCVLIADLRALLPKVQTLLEPAMGRGPLQTLMERVEVTLSA